MGDNPTDDALFAPPIARTGWRERADARGWPPDLLDRMLALRFPTWKIEQGLSADGFPTLEMFLSEANDRERLERGTLRMREATWEDDERLSDLFANSAERLGEWDVTVERWPNPFAQHRIQENAHVKVLEDRGVAMGVSAQAGRSSFVGGKPLSVAWMGGWRVRNGFRRLGYSSMLLNSPGSSASVFGMVTYWYVRTENGVANTWISHELENIEGVRRIEKLSATVHHLDASHGADTAPDHRIRPINSDDLDACVALINRTHDGLDLFRPYSAEFLRSRLDDLFWGPKPPFTPTVYGWPDTVVLEDHDVIVACGGLWDRGRDVRERWRHRSSGDERTTDNTCLLDFGCAAGREDALADVIAHLLATTQSLGRTTLVAPLEFLPGVLERLRWAAPRDETRNLEVMVFRTPELQLDAAISRPYTDLAYW